MQVLNQFEEFWKTVDESKYEPGITDGFVNECLADDKNTLLEFCLNKLKKQQTRRDYKVFLELAVIFLGGELPKGIVFHRPGAHHHARCMAKEIYSLKIFIFRAQFFRNDKLNKMKFRDVCTFIIKVFIQACFNTTFAAQAPYQDLQFLKKLSNYKTIDKSISEGAIKKFRNHLWYLTPESAALPFFFFFSKEKLKQMKLLSRNKPLFHMKKEFLLQIIISWI